MVWLLHLVGMLALAPGAGDGPAGPASARRLFTARVESIEILPGRAVPGGTVVVHPDPRWLLRLRVLRVEHTAAGSGCPARMAYAVHSPVKLFRMNAGAARGKVFRFAEQPVVDTAGHDVGQMLEVRPARRFDTLRGWRRLRWNMSDQEVRTALGKMGYLFEVEELRGHFAAPAPPPGSAAKRPPETVVATFTHLRFTVESGRAEAELMGWRLRLVRVQSPSLATGALVEARLRSLRRKLGEPDRSNPPSSEPGALRLSWSNAESSLEVHTLRTPDGWFVTETYRRVPYGYP